MLFNYTPPIVTIPTAPIDSTTLEFLALRGIYPATEHPHSVKDRYSFHCPLQGHPNDTHPSFSVHSDGIRWKCFPCGMGGGPAKLIELLGSEPNARTPKLSKPLKKPTKEAEEPLQGCTLPQLAEAKGLPIEHLRNLGWYDSEWKYKLNGYWTTCPSVAMPYPNAIQHRVGLTDKKNRFRWQVGFEASAKELYGAEWLRAIDKTVLVVEGTTDVAAALLLRVPVVGLPGTGTWSRKTGPIWAKELESRDVVLWQEPGEAGQKLVDSVAQDVPDLRVIQAPPGIKDICELLDQAGSGAGDILRELIDEAQLYYEFLPGKTHVTPTVTGILGLCNLMGDRRERSALWKSVEEIFPMPDGIKPWTRGAIVFNRRLNRPIAVDFIGNTWRNEANAQHKRRCLMYNLLPRLNYRDLYVLRVPVDDWSEQTHQTLKQRIHRAMAKDKTVQSGWVWFDTALRRGCYTYLSNLPDLPGFDPVEDVESLLVDCLKSITPPDKASTGRFRPYGGSKSWTTKIESTGEDDRDVCDVIAISNGPTDFVQLEAECIASGIRYWSTRPYWRGQVGSGLEMNMGFDEAVKLASDLGYHLTKHGRVGAMNVNELVGSARS
jgi:hypothetical protein